MDNGAGIQQALAPYEGAVVASRAGVEIRDSSAVRSPATDRVVWQAVFGQEPDRRAARWVLWELGQAAGVRPASIHDLYMARGRGDCGGFTVPAINVRMLAYDTARAVFRAAIPRRVGAMLLEIARSEIGYTDQRPAEYVAVMLGAALREGYELPLFIQGDHCQVNAKKYQTDPDGEVGEVKALIAEEVAAGFYNVDVDTSTLVDLSRPGLDQQQRANYERAAEITAFIRGLEPPGVTVSVGAEIGEVGQKNSTVEELHAFMRGYTGALAALGKADGEGGEGGRDYVGISKISVQTGTSHGGVVLPDGSIAEVKLDLQALEALSAAARGYGLAGAVQHGASTLPSNAFGHFPRVGATEIHLATNFQNIVFEHPAVPPGLSARVRAWLDANAAGDRKAGDTPEQFYYRARKRAIGPFKREMWELPAAVRSAIAADLERTFGFLFEQLAVPGTDAVVRRHVAVPLTHHASLAQVGSAADDPDAGE